MQSYDVVDHAETTSKFTSKYINRGAIDNVYSVPKPYMPKDYLYVGGPGQFMTEHRKAYVNDA
jgi:hypothetical protein